VELGTEMKNVVKAAKEARQQLRLAKNCPYCQDLQNKMIAHMEKGHKD